MTHPDILAALARERSAALLAEAEADRRARQARPGPPAVSLGARGFLLHWLAGRRRPGTSAYGRALATTPRQELAATPRTDMIMPGNPGDDESAWSVSQRC